MVAKVIPLSQDKRPAPSVPLNDADLGLDNSNWQKGLQASSDWIWSANLNPAAFPNNLARYFLQIPGIFEHQLHFSTSLIFDEPSFKNGIQMSGFVPRISRELAISLIAQRRRCWYSMTHHAILGRLTAMKHGLSEAQYRDKWANLNRFEDFEQHYSKLEYEVLRFASKYCRDPKTYSDDDLDKLKEALSEYNSKHYPGQSRWLDQLKAARKARAEGLLQGMDEAELQQHCKAAAEAVAHTLSRSLNEDLVNAQLVELAFLCLQFVALTCVFTGLNIHDEGFLPSTMVELLPHEVIVAINELNELGGEGMGPLLPPPVKDIDSTLIKAIADSQITTEPSSLKGARVPLVSYESPDYKDRDKGVTVGGINVGVYGWGFGTHFPGSLVYALMHHPELARHEAPYSLPVLFNEDEWRNGVQTSGFVTRRLKEIVIQKIYKLNRCRYGIEHHTTFLFNTFHDEHGSSISLNPTFAAGSNNDKNAQTEAANRATETILWTSDPDNAPRGVFSDTELAAMAWTEALMATPHSAHKLESNLRYALEADNQREIAAGLRRLDTSPGLGDEAAMKRLLDHQIAELCMMVGHMDGLGRAMTILRLESEDAAAPFPIKDVVDIRKGKNPIVKPALNSDGDIEMTGTYNVRPSLFEWSGFIGIGPAVLTLNEFTVNPKLCAKAKKDWKKNKKAHYKANTAEKTGEF